MTDAPFISQLMDVRPEWEDYNGHLNMAYYNVLFDQGVDEIWTQMGFGPAYREQTGHSTFSAEFHVCYLRELHVGDKVRASFQLLDFDEKRFHFYLELIHQDGWVSASAEGLGLHVDQSGPRVAPVPDRILANIRALHAKHAALPRPERVGRVMGIPPKKR